MSRRAAWAVVTVAALCCALFLWHALARYWTFHNRTYDLAFYARMAWGTVHGSYWDPIVNAHFAGLHMSLVMIPLGALGALFGTVPVLLATQALAIGAASWPLARMGARRHGDVGALFASLAWLLYPNLGHASTYEFHPGTVATLPLAWALDCLDRGHARGLAFSAAAVAACRADMSAVAVILGLLAIPQGGRMRRHGLWVSVLSGGYLLLFLLVLHPLFAPAHGSLQLHFAKWGSSVPGIVGALLAEPTSLAAHLLHAERLAYIPKLLAPLAFLPLLAPRWLLPAVPLLGINLLSEFPTAMSMDCHYQTPLVPPLVVAAMAGLARVRSWKERLPLHGMLQGLAWVSLAAALALSNAIAGGMPWSLDYAAGEFRADEAGKSARRILELIPEGASVQAPDRLLPHVAERKDLYRLPPPERGAAFLVLDIGHRQRYAGRGDLLRTTEEPEVRNWFARKDHAVVHAEGDLVLMRRGAAPRQGVGGRYIRGTASKALGTPITDCLSVAGASLARDRLTLELIALGPCPNDLAIHFGALPKNPRVDLLFDGLLSPVHLRLGDHLQSYHSLDPEERAAIEAEGLYVGALRQSGARPLPTDPTSVRVLVE